jgi:hypothetical protein
LIPGLAGASHIESQYYRALQPESHIAETRDLQRLETLRRRVCERVQRRFADDPVMQRRIDTRLEKRFGFTCSSGVGGSGVSEPEEPKITETLTVFLDPFNALQDNVPKGASHIPVLTANFSASCERSVEIESVDILDRGAGLATDVLHVWMSIDGHRASISRRLSNDKTANMRFRTALVVPRCETVSVDFLAAFSATALDSGRHQFSLAASEYIYTETEVIGEFPLTGPVFKVAAQSSGNIVITYLPIEEDPRIDGTQREVIGRFLVDTDTFEDQTLHAITLENAARADDGDFVNIYIRAAAGRAQFTRAVQETVRDFTTFFFDPPFPLVDGESIELEVVADIITNTGATIQMQFEEEIDLYSIGSLTGFGTTGQQYGSHVSVEGTAAKVKIR